MLLESLYIDDTTLQSFKDTVISTKFDACMHLPRCPCHAYRGYRTELLSSLTHARR